MSDKTTSPQRRTGTDGWSVVAAAGLLAVALFWDRIAPAERTPGRSAGDAFPDNRPRSRPEAGRTSSGASMATSPTTASSRSPLA